MNSTATVAFKRLAEPILGKMLQPAQASTDEVLAPYLKAGHVTWQGLNLPEALPEMWVRESNILELHPEVGDLLICEGGEVGRAAIVSAPLEPSTIIQNSVHLVRPAERADPRYLKYALEHVASSGWLDIVCNKATIAHLTVEKLRELKVPFQHRPDQVRIANFLDDKTAQIDALIAEKERLLLALEEWRAAELTRICFGQETATEDTGNRWIPALPLGWCLRRLKHLVSGIEQGWSPECEARLAEEDAWAVLKAGAANGGTFRESEHKALPAHLEPIPDLEVKPGDVLATRASGSADYVGSVAFVYSTRPKLMLSDKNFRFKFDKAPPLQPELLAWMCNTQPLREQILQFVGGAEGLAKNIGSGNLREIWLAVPPMKEQARIIILLKERREQLEKLRHHLDEHIDRLREYRSSLISAAVTGQLDVGAFEGKH